MHDSQECIKHTCSTIQHTVTPAWNKTGPCWRFSFITGLYLGKEVGGHRVHAVLQLVVKHGSLCVTCRKHSVTIQAVFSLSQAVCFFLKN